MLGLKTPRLRKIARIPSFIWLKHRAERYKPPSSVDKRLVVPSLSMPIQKNKIKDQI